MKEREEDRREEDKREEDRRGEVHELQNMNKYTNKMRYLGLCNQFITRCMCTCLFAFSEKHEQFKSHLGISSDIATKGQRPL